MPERRPDARLMRQGRWSQDRGQRRQTLSDGQHAETRRRALFPLGGSVRRQSPQGQRRRERCSKDRRRKHASSSPKRGNARQVATAPATARPMWSGTADAAGLKAEPERKNPLAGGTRRRSGPEETRSQEREPKGRERRKDAVSSGAGKRECQQRRQWGPAAMPALIWFFRTAHLVGGQPEAARR